jgi:hypothetical protein
MDLHAFAVIFNRDRAAVVDCNHADHRRVHAKRAENESEDEEDVVFHASSVRRRDDAPCVEDGG